MTQSSREPAATPSRSPADFAVLHAAQLVCVGHGAAGPRIGEEQGRLDVIPDGALVAREGRILAVGPTREIAAAYPLGGARMIDASGKVVLPGLVDSHSHPLFAGVRFDEYAERLAGADRAEIAARGGGIWWSVERTRAASDAELMAIAERHFAEILGSGTTTLEAKSGYGQTVDEELRQLDVIGRAARRTPLRVVPTVLGAHIVPREHATAAGYAAEIIERMLPAVHAQGIARFCDTSCDVRTFGPELTARILGRAADLGLPGRLHADGSRSSRGWITAVRGGAASADHLTYTPDGEIEEAGPTRTVATLLPTAEMYYFYDRRANARRFIQTGVPVAIATDFSSSIHSPSLSQCLGLAAAWYRMTPEEVLSAATINAAWSLGLAGEAGSLEPGKRADLLVVNVPHYRMLIYEFGMPRVETVVVGGQIVGGGPSGAAAPGGRTP